MMLERRILRAFHSMLMYTYLFFAFDAPHCSTYQPLTEWIQGFKPIWHLNQLKVFLDYVLKNFECK
ncbi:hypothetical protein EFN47_03660 [Pediococcus acidilactici]|nr:hypothetical protein [Pediococcus acidilactici]